jgi:hypothetical protein
LPSRLIPALDILPVKAFDLATRTAFGRRYRDSFWTPRDIRDTNSEYGGDPPIMEYIPSWNMVRVRWLKEVYCIPTTAIKKITLLNAE